MRSFNSHQIHDKMLSQIDKILHGKVTNVIYLMQNKIENDPAYNRAVEVQKRIKEEGSDYSGNIVVEICRLPIKSKIYMTGYEIRTITLDERYFGPLFNSSIDYETYFNDEEKAVIKEYCDLYNRVNVIYKEFCDALNKSNTVKDFNKNYKFDKMIEGLK